PVLARVQRAHPALEIELFTSTQRARQNRSGLDLEIVVGKPEVPRAWEQPLFEYELKLYATEAYLADNGTPARLQDLQTHRLNYYVEAILLVQDLDDALTMLPPMRPGLSSANVYAHLTATLAGAGIGLLPDFMAGGHPMIVQVFEDVLALAAAVSDVVPVHSVRSPAVATAYQALKDHDETSAIVSPADTPVIM